MGRYNEYSVGEIFDYEGIKLKVIADSDYDCLDCHFYDVNCNFNGLSCAYEEREDGTEVSFKRVCES